MNNLDNMLERNKDFAAQQSAAGTLMPSLPRAKPNVKATIIGCADTRADNNCALEKVYRPAIRLTKESHEPLQTSPSETPLAARRLSPWPPCGQEQYLDYYSAGKPTLAALSAFSSKPLSEANCKADYSFASAKPAEGSEDVRSWPQAQNQTSKPADSDSEQVQKVLVEKLSIECQEQPTTPVPDPPAKVPPRPAYAKPWTAYELQMVRDCGSTYTEGDTPPANFESNCELAAVGYTAAEVIACLGSKFAKRRYRLGEKFGP
jgi:hypothetical protein